MTVKKMVSFKVNNQKIKGRFEKRKMAKRLY